MKTSERRKAEGKCPKCETITGGIRCEYHEQYAVTKTAEYYARIKQKVLNAYGRCCAHCGFADTRILELDHVNNDGVTHRNGGTCQQTWTWAVNNNYPDSLQLLCPNCHTYKTKGLNHEAEVN